MKILAAFVLVCVMSIPAYAGGWSFGMDGGLAVPTQNYFPTNTGDINTHSLPYFQALEASEGAMVSAYVTHTLGASWFHAGIMGLYDTTGASADGAVTPDQYYQEGRPISGAKMNLGMVSTWAFGPYIRITPWTFGNWTPFIGVGELYGWNGWSVPATLKVPDASFGTRITPSLVTRMELGTEYAFTPHIGAEAMIGFQENDALASLDLPSGQGGMDQEFQMSLFFVEIGVHFGF